MIAKIKDYVIIALLIALAYMMFQQNSKFDNIQIDYKSKEESIIRRLDSLDNTLSKRDEQIDEHINSAIKSQQKTQISINQLKNEKQLLQQSNDSTNIAWFHAYIEQWRNGSANGY
jgi:uncharacterized membrane protein YgaE (UPF0421/DUF939 family)